MMTKSSAASLSRRPRVRPSPAAATSGQEPIKEKAHRNSGGEEPARTLDHLLLSARASQDDPCASSRMKWASTLRPPVRRRKRHDQRDPHRPEEFDVLFIDECHRLNHAVEETYRRWKISRSISCSARPDGALAQDQLKPFADRATTRSAYSCRCARFGDTCRRLPQPEELETIVQRWPTSKRTD